MTTCGLMCWSVREDGCLNGARTGTAGSMTKCGRRGRKGGRARTAKKVMGSRGDADGEGTEYKTGEELALL